MSIANWPAYDPQQVHAALATVTAIVGNVPATTVRLRRYYDLEGDYAGETFLTAPPNDVDRITAADLHAVGLLEVKIGPAASRRLLDDPRLGADIHIALRTTPNVDLAGASDEDLCAASDLYRSIHAALGTPDAARADPWVTASKLAARKRPRLIPVRDRLVRELLGTQPPHSFRADWLLYRAIASDKTIMDCLRRVLGELGRTIHDPLLRVLDVALWTKADENRKGSANP